MNRKLFFVMIYSLSLSMFLSACINNEKPEITMYVGLSEDHAIKVIEEFQKETGIRVSYVNLSSGEILARIRAERENPQTSIWYGGPADTFIQAKKEGLLRSHFSDNAMFIDDIFKDNEGYWTGIYVGSIAFASNKDWLSEMGLAPPQSWEDLLKPEYRGMVTMSNPTTSGTGYTILSTLVQLWGEEKAFDYFHELHQNIQSYTISGRVPARYVGMGDTGIAIVFAHDAVKFYKEGFHSISISFPLEGTGYEIGAVGLIKGGPYLEESKQFIDWVLTKDAQEIGKRIGNYQLLTNREAVSPSDAYIPSNVNPVVYDHDWSGLNRDRLLKRWREEIGD